jgi:cell division protein FtsB
MGALWVFFMGKPVDKLKTMKAKREAKIRKLEAEVNAIEIEISKKKDEK